MKQIINKRVKYDLPWKYELVSIEQIRKDLDTIEKLGATHVEFNVESDYGNYVMDIAPISSVLETDEEYQARMDDIKNRAQKKKDAELAEYNRLKAKYEYEKGQ